jgi:DNA polymerase-3 subunit beta
MTFNCSKQQLLDALTMVTRAVPTRTTMPILECVLLQAEENALTLTANDMEISIQCSQIAAHVEKPGELALDAKLFTDIVRKMSGDAIYIEADDRGGAVVKGGRSRLKISGQPSAEFPQVIKDEMETATAHYKVPAATLKDMIRKTIFSVAADQTKMILTGELLNIENEMLQMVAIDMFRISFAAEKISGAVDSKAVVPGKALSELSRILPADDSVVHFFFTEKKVVFEAETFTLVSTLLTGDFIRYDQIFNEDFTTMVVADRQQLLGAFERAVLMAMENRMLPIKMDIKDDDLTVSSESDRGTVEDGIPCETEGQDLTIYFNPRYFIEALRVIEDEKVVLKLNTVLSPCSIRGAESEAFKYLIVPLRPPQ